MQHVFSKGEPALHLGALCFVVGPPPPGDDIAVYPHTWVRYVEDGVRKKVNENQLQIPHEKALSAVMPLKDARQTIRHMAERHAQARRENRRLYMSQKLVEREENAGL